MEYLYDASTTISPATTAELAASMTLGKHDSASSAASTPPMKKKRGDNIRRAPGGTQAQHAHGSLEPNTPSPVNAASARSAAMENKPKRVRTGCLTCRERHLKCDEGRPDCQNCIKSQRECKRGIRLNYIDFQTSDRNAYFIPRGKDWTVAFQDESREIAKEYNGDWRYPPEKRNSSASNAAAAGNNFYYMAHQTGMAPPTSVSHQPLPPIQGILPDSYQPEQQFTIEPQQASSHQHGRGHSRESVFSGTATAPSPYSIEASASPAPAPGARDYLTSQEEVLFMQVFVEEVGIWMDSMDSQKHFSRLLPFHALSEPMLLNSFFACGARHLALVNPKYSEDKALAYYDMATRHLLDSLQDPNRDTVLCATTAVILNVYEIMCERALQRMNHIAGARALIKECGWNAKSTGIGAACFWLNVGMEILSCLHFNWQVAWDPDDWGVDLDFSRETESGKEELWTHRILYIVAKVCNFRASIPRNEEAARQTLESRHAQWLNLKKMADRWNENIPRTMHPLAYLYPGSTISGSAFPEVWLIKRTSIVARLFYHTSLVLLAQINPIKGPTDPEMQTMLDRNSQLICGISAHVKDRGVASVALRSLAIAAECLTERREQEEVLQIFDKIRQETGWRVGFVNAELKKKWGWDGSQPVDMNSNSSVQSDSTIYQQQDQAHQAQMALQQATPTTIQVTVPAPAPAPARPAFPTGVMNPILATADFSMPQHPYQTHYVAPNSMHQAPQQQQQPSQQGHPTGDFYYKHFTN